MQELPEKIYIISDEKIRAEQIQSLIHNSVKSAIDVAILNTSHFDTPGNFPDNALYIIDLVSTNEPSGFLIRKVKGDQPGRKILALHIYRSAMLINPLYNMGINGYLYYNSSKEELMSAIKNIYKGKRHIPKFQWFA